MSTANESRASERAQKYADLAAKYLADATRFPGGDHAIKQTNALTGIGYALLADHMLAVATRTDDANRRRRLGMFRRLRGGR